MAYLKKKIIGSKAYYYIGHSYRQNGKVRYKETYIGNEVPGNMKK